jgi:uncharacterized membrane protein YfcA
MLELLLVVVLGIGVGGGILFVPILVLFFDFGQVEAEATSLLAILPTVIAGSWRQHGYGNVRWRAAAIMGLGAVAGVQAGVLVAHALPEEDLRKLFGVLMLAIAAQIAWRARRGVRGVS